MVSPDRLTWPNETIPTLTAIDGAQRLLRIWFAELYHLAQPLENQGFSIDDAAVRDAILYKEHPGRAPCLMTTEVIVGSLRSSTVIYSSSDNELRNAERSGTKFQVLHSVWIGLSGVRENRRQNAIRRILDKVSEHRSDSRESHHDRLGAGNLSVVALPCEIVERSEYRPRDPARQIHVHFALFASRR